YELAVRLRIRRITIQTHVVRNLRMPGLQESHPLFEQIVDRDANRTDGWFGGELGKRADAALQAINFVDDDLRGLFDEGRVDLAVAREYFFHRQPDRRERILDLMRHLSG